MTSSLSRISYAATVDLTLGVPLTGLLASSRRILEVGLGRAGRTWHRLLTADQLSRGVGLDVHLPYLRHWHKAESGWAHLVRGTGSMLPFRDAAFDSTLALDVIEHLPKPGGLALIREMVRVSASRVILLTPNGFLPQSPEDGNEAQRHLSGWTRGDLEALGFKIMGLRGLRALRGEFARPCIAPYPVGEVIALASAPLGRLFPDRAFQLLAVLDTGPMT